MRVRRRFVRALLGFAAVVAGVLPAHGQDDGALRHQSWGTAEGLPQNSVHALAQTPDGFLWIATEAGLARFDGAQFRVFGRKELGRTASEDLCCLAVDGDGVLWVGSSFGLAAFSHSHALPLPDSAPFSRNPVHQMSVQDGHVVATTDAGSLTLRVDGKAEPSGSAHVSADVPILRDREGNRWIGSANGLEEIPHGQTAVTDIPALAGQTVLALLEDADGNLWVGTETTGLHRLQHGVFRTLAGTQGTPATAVSWSGAGVVLGTRDGDLRLVTTAGEVRKLAHFGATITSLAVTPTDVWAGTTDGLYRVGKDAHIRRYTSADGLPDDYIRSLAADSEAGVWAGTAHGLARLTGTGVEVLTAKNGLGGNLLGALLPAPVSSGNPARVWAATETGLALVERSHVVQHLDVVGSAVAGMAYDQAGTLWFATQDGGLWQAREKGAQKILQLPSASDRQSVQALFIDRRNTLWIVLRDGVLSTPVPRLSACAQQSCRSLTSLLAGWGAADGMPSAESLPGSFSLMAQDGRGEVLFATRAGIAVADPDAAARAAAVPAVIERTTLEDRALEEPELQRIPYGRNRLTFDYVGISLGDAGRVRYRVRLRGFDPDWIETGTRRTATYTSLPPGSYHFEVQATLEGQPWPDAAASLDLRIAPPFYRRWWFLLLAGILFAGLVLLVYRLRLAAERRRFAVVMAERNRLAREVHDTLAQDLVSTGIQLDVVMFGLAEQPPERTLELLRTLRSRVSQALAQARESISELRDPNLRLDLASRLQRLAERKSPPSQAVRVEVHGALRPLPAGVEMELLRIAGEAVQNAVRHANAGSITVHVDSTAEMLTLTVADNGCGFIPAAGEAMTRHYGLRGMRERAEAIGATLSVTSSPGHGTSVAVRVRYAR